MVDRRSWTRRCAESRGRRLPARWSGVLTQSAAMPAESEHVREAVKRSVQLLRPEVRRDWSIEAGTVAWSCFETAAHVSNDLLRYAGQIVGQPRQGYLRFHVRAASDATPSDLLDMMHMAGGLLALAVETADSGSTAWHYGPTDPTGFAAMGVGETILHTFDIASGFGIDWTPLPDLCEFVLARMFPEFTDGAPVDRLLWLTGRGALGDLPPRTDWVWHAAR